MSGIWCAQSLGILGTGHAGILSALSECRTKAVTVQSPTRPREAPTYVYPAKFPILALKSAIIWHSNYRCSVAHGKQLIN
jgi:hypothetical protein